MKKVLVFQNQLYDVVDADAEFPVSPEMVWMDLPDGVSGATHEFNGIEFVLKPAQVFLSAPTPGSFAVPPTSIAPLDFLERFTLTEQLAITTAAMQSPQIRLWYDKMLAARSIDVADVRVAAGLDSLIDAGLLDASRKSALLTPAGQVPVTVV